MTVNWSNINQRCFRLVENWLITRTKHIKDHAIQGYNSEVFRGDSNPNVYFSTTCCTSKLVSDFINYLLLKIDFFM